VFYRFADLVISSEIPIAELPVVEAVSAECHLQLGGADSGSERWDHHWRSPDGAVSLSCARDGAVYRLRAPGLATFRIDCDGRLITCAPEHAVPPETLEHLVIDQVLPRVLSHLGRLVLHAGCVATPHGAVAFLGDSGAGKSTLVAEFARAGFPLLGDDGIVLRPRDSETFEAVATYPGLRLLPDPLALLFDSRAGAAPVAHYTSKRRLDPGRARLTLAAAPQPLIALYLLEPGQEVRIDPMPTRDAFLALLRASFQLHLDDEQRARGVFDRLGALLDTVPVRRLAYPRQFARLSDVRDAVLTDAADLASRASSAGCACS
jgi:hypothetical protein